VVEHIVGDLAHLVASRRRAKIAAWDRALKELIDAAHHPRLKIRGFRAGREESEEVPPEEFPEVADNPVSDFDFGIEFSGKRILEFDKDYGAKSLRSHSNGAPEVLWTNLCAESGAEVLKLWPKPTKPTAKASSKSKCSEWLVAARRAGPPKMTKEEYKAEAINLFRVGPDQFRTAWDEAAKLAPSQSWGRAGRPKKSSGLKSSGQ
jgi:hypothetical protein